MWRRQSREVIYYNVPLARHQHFIPVREKERAESFQEKEKKENK